MLLTKNEVFKTLRLYKDNFLDDGIKIVGLFGSFSRNNADDSSDVDVMIETTSLFHKRYKGLKAIVKLSELREFLEEKFQRDVDIVDKKILLKSNNTHILKKTIYV